MTATWVVVWFHECWQQQAERAVSADGGPTDGGVQLAKFERKASS